MNAGRVDTVVADRPELLLTSEEREVLAELLAELLIQAIAAAPAEAAG